MRTGSCFRNSTTRNVTINSSEYDVSLIKNVNWWQIFGVRGNNTPVTGKEPRPTHHIDYLPLKARPPSYLIAFSTTKSFRLKLRSWTTRRSIWWKLSSKCYPCSEKETRRSNQRRLRVRLFPGMNLGAWKSLFSILPQKRSSLRRFCIFNKIYRGRRDIIRVRFILFW